MPKRYYSQKAKAGDSWRHTKITLKPINPEFTPLEFIHAQGNEIVVIAELVDVLAMS